MPSPFDPETQPIPFDRHNPATEASGHTSPGGTKAKKNKKARRNGAEESGGSVPEMSKLESRMAELAKPPSPLSEQESSPGVRPVIDTPLISATTSPGLDPLSSNALSHAFAHAKDRDRSVQALAGSPGNLISLGGSPSPMASALPSSYEDRILPGVWTKEERDPNGTRQPSALPLPHRPRPRSFQLDGQDAFQEGVVTRVEDASPRSPTYSQQGQRYGSHPRLPHQAQAHLYGAPDPVFDLPARSGGLRPGARGYYSGFDSISLPAQASSGNIDDVILSGYEGGLSVHTVSNHGLRKLVNIEGLRGGVYFAKILPWTAQGKARECYPLIAVVLHGPALSAVDTTRGDAAAGPAPDVSAFPRPGSARGSSREASRDFDGSQITHYQTTVEIYSLSSRAHISTLLTLPAIPINMRVTNSHFVPPLPAGSLRIAADAGNIVVSSGTTGEVWLYQQYTTTEPNSVSFRCTGKVWTTVQEAPTHEPNRSAELGQFSAPSSDSLSYRQQHRTALVALKGRWLAYCPPSATSQAPLKALVPVTGVSPKHPGLNSFAAPQAPPVNCAVEMPEGDTLLNRLTREAAQAALKGARWVGDQGYQVWNNYWHKQSSNDQTATPVSAAQYWSGSSPPRSDRTHAFPPTHGEALQRTATMSEAQLISILDVEKLGTTVPTSSATSPHPLATFKAPLGCSFLSFSPSGLALFSASSKGEVQIVWDLMKIQHTKPSALQRPSFSTPQGQHIRQLAMSTRMTPARIVEVVWGTPRGDRLAMVTDRNTVHFWDLPPSAFSWPAMRRRSRNPASRLTTATDAVEGSKTATTLASSAVTAALSLAQPLMKRPRGLSGSGRAGITAASMTAQAGQGGKALANGISRSFGAATGTLESLYKSGDNRIHLPRSTSAPWSGCIKWLEGRRRNNFVAVVDGVVFIYNVKQRKAMGSEKQQIAISRKPLKLELPLIPDHSIAPLILRALDLEEELDLTETDHGFQWDQKPRAAVKVEQVTAEDSCIPQAEIESNPPYQPFHTDRRVGLHMYSNPSVQSPSPSVSALLAPLMDVPRVAPSVDNAPWVFGRPIDVVKLDIGPCHVDDDDPGAGDDHQVLRPSAMERITTKISESDEEVDQIVITTRRRRGVTHGNGQGFNGDDDGFFEDDCEVLDFATQRV